MSIKVFTMPVNNSGKVEFTRQELEKLLNDVYNDGYRKGESDAKSNYWTWCPTITGSTTNATTPSITYLNNCAATGSTNAAADTLEMKVPTTNTSFSINGEKVDLSTFSKSIAEANDAFNKAVNSIARSTRYNNPNVENILAKEIRGL